MKTFSPPPPPVAAVVPIAAGITRVSETDEFGVTTVLYQDALGRPSRLDGPAVRQINATGEVIQEEWRVEGVLHREDGPAEIKTAPRYNSVAVIEKYYFSGQKHRLDGPAVIQTYRGGNRDGEVFEQWYREDALHREDGPAQRMIHPDGSVFIEHYYQGGAKHRVDGPASRRIKADGDVEESFHQHWQVGGYTTLWGSLGDVEKDVRAGNSRGIETLRTSPGYRKLLDEGVDPLELVTLVRSGISDSESIRSILIDGAPEEWVRAYEQGRSS